MRKKSPHFHASSSLNMAVRGGLTRFARPFGQIPRRLVICPTGCASCRTPVGDSHPPAGVQHAKKKPAFSCELFFKYGGEGGIDSLCSPLRADSSQARHLSNWLRQLSNPGRGFSSPPQVCNMRKKSPYLRTSSFSNMAVRGGFEPPIRCRIHTFQACSFSHSDTSPYCLPSIAGTSANVGKRAVSVNKLFRKIVRLDKLQANCFLNIHKSSFLRSPLHFSGRVSEICYSVKPQK